MDRQIVDHIYKLREKKKVVRLQVQNSSDLYMILEKCFFISSWQSQSLSQQFENNLPGKCTFSSQIL